MDPQFTCMSFKKDGDATIAMASCPVKGLPAI